MLSKTWLVDVRTLASKPTGVGMYAYRLLRKLIADGEGRFILLSDVNDSAELQELAKLGCEIRIYGRRIFKSSAVIRYFAWMKRQIADVRPDVFWEPNNLLPFRPKGVGRVIVTIHDVFGLGWSWRYAAWHLYYRFSFWRTLRNVTEIWYNSNATRLQLESRLHRSSLLSHRFSITHPIADVPPIETIPAWQSPRPYFLYVGNVESRKGADLLFEAYRRYREEVTSRSEEGKRAEVVFDLVVAGLERNVKVPDWPGLVKLGYVDDATKFSLMRSCAAFIVPSRDEGYGMQLAEALKLGVRVIASDVPVFEEVVGGQGAIASDVAWLKGFVGGTDEQRVTLLKDALAIQWVSC